MRNAKRPRSVRMVCAKLLCSALRKAGLVTLCRFFNQNLVASVNGLHGRKSVSFQSIGEQRKQRILPDPPRFFWLAGERGEFVLRSGERYAADAALIDAIHKWDLLLLDWNVGGVFGCGFAAASFFSQPLHLPPGDEAPIIGVCVTFHPELARVF